MVNLALIRLDNEGSRCAAGRRPGQSRRSVRPAGADRIHAYAHSASGASRARSRPDFIRFLLRWRRVPADTQRGQPRVLAVVEQLQGFELAAGAWEKAIFRPG